MDNADGCGSSVNDRVVIVLGFGWFYFFAGPTILSCNLCCVCCDKTDYAGDDEEFHAKQAEKEAKKQKKYKATSNTNGADIESPNPPPQQQPEKKRAPSPPRTYSVDGVPVADDGNANVVEAEVVIEGDTLPPPMAPPKEGFNTDEAKAKAKEAAAKAQATAQKAAQSLGGWFNKKKGSDLPDKKATVY